MDILYVIFIEYNDNLASDATFAYRTNNKKHSRSEVNTYLTCGFELSKRRKHCD